MTLMHEQPHYRKLIRARIKQLVKEEVKFNPDRIFFSRPNPVFLPILPVCLIYFDTEEADHRDTVPRSYSRKLTLITEVLHGIDPERENGMDDYFDSRAFELERAFLSDRFLGLSGIVEDVQLNRTEVINLDFGGDRLCGSQRIFWIINYVTNFNFEGSLDDFLKFNTKYELQIGLGANAEDMVTIRTE
jgi:hypothetical protein